MNSWIVLGIVALVLAAGVWFLAQPSFIPRDLNLEERLSATNSLRNACSELWIDSFPKPDGEACTSISNAVVASLKKHEAFNWWMTVRRTNGFIHLNPDWQKWTATATNEHAFPGELAAYCSPAIFGTNQPRNLFLGVTFDQQFVGLTNPPAWPRAVDLIQQ